MNIQQSLNRGFNLLATSIVSLAGFSFLPEAFVEKDMPDKIDDFVLFLLGIFGLWWYNKSENRYVRSYLPVVLISLACLVKIVGLIIELDDPEAFGDDIGGVILFVIGTLFVLTQYKKTGKLLTGQR